MGVDSIIRVLLVDDQNSIHTLIGELIRSSPDIVLVAEAYDGDEAARLCDQFKPDIVLMDINMPINDGIAVTRTILARHPEIQILALTGLDDTDVVQDMIVAGAVGYLLKNAHPEKLLDAIRTAYQGQSVFSRDIVPSLFSDRTDKPISPFDQRLTSREMDVLRLMAEGLNNNEIAERLQVSTATVRFHITNIVKKLNANNRIQALMIAVRNKLV